MKDGLTYSLVVAFGAGGALAAVTALEGFISRKIGPIGASVVEHVAIGSMSVAIFFVMISRDNLQWSQVRGILPQIVIAGILVFIAVIGIAYVIPRVGVAAGNFALVLGQIIAAVVIDSIGLVGTEKIPLSLPRLAGFVLMSLGVYFVFFHE